MENVLIYLYDKYNGKWEDIYKAIQEKERVDFEQAQQVGYKYRKEYNVITIISPDYPECYKHDYFKPPFVILERKVEC